MVSSISWLHAVGVGARQIYLVENGNDFVVVIEGHIDVGEGLRLHALGGVHHEQRAFAGRKRTGDFVAEVHVSGGVDEVQNVLGAVLVGVGNAHGLRLDGDASFAFQIHFVEVLVAGFAGAHHAGVFQNAVGKGGLAVIDMGDDAEITDFVE